MALINCPVCGEKVSDKAEKCLKCGSTLIEEIANDASVKKETNQQKTSNTSYTSNLNLGVNQYRDYVPVNTVNQLNTKKRISGFAVFGIVLGLALIAVGIYMSSKKMGYSFDIYETDASFGADFYTYEYSATRSAAMNTGNIGHLLEGIYKDAGVIVSIIGGVVVAYFGRNLKV